jgi:hypothetical protein
MIATIVDQTGDVVSVITAVDQEHIDLNTPAGCTAIEGAAPLDSYFDLTAKAWVLKPARPATYSTWDAQTKAWIDGRTLAQVQADQWSSIKARRDAEILTAGATPSGTFDTTPEGLANVTSVAVMLMANPAIASVNFTLADNTRPAIARADFIAAAQTIGAAVQALYDHAATLRTQIEAATTTATVQAIAW